MTKLRRWAPAPLRATLCALALAATLGLGVGAADAQVTAGETPGDRATAFRAVTGPETESVPGGAFLVGAYGVFLALVVAYVVRLDRLGRGTNERLARLERLLEQKTAQRG